jgi:hypothetical protein
MNIKSAEFRVVISCGSERIRRFGVTSPLSSGSKIRASKKPAELGRKLSSAGFMRVADDRAPYTCINID